MAVPVLDTEILGKGTHKLCNVAFLSNQYDRETCINRYHVMIKHACRPITCTEIKRVIVIFSVHQLLTKSS